MIKHNYDHIFCTTNCQSEKLDQLPREISGKAWAQWIKVDKKNYWKRGYNLFQVLKRVYLKQSTNSRCIVYKP